MLWSSQQFGTLTTYETSRNNNIQLSNTFQLCLCTYSICLYYYYNYDDIQIQSACIMTSVQAGAVLMPLAMFLLSLKSIRVLY